MVCLPSLVSDEILQKSINTMQGNLKKLEKELDIYKPLNDREDKFIPVMKISFTPLGLLKFTLSTNFPVWESLDLDNAIVKGILNTFRFNGHSLDFSN